MFQALNAHHQEANCIDEAAGIALSVSGRPVHMLRENCVLPQTVHWTATDREDDTRCCINEIKLLMMSM